MLRVQPCVRVPVLYTLVLFVCTYNKRSGMDQVNRAPLTPASKQALVSLIPLPRHSSAHMRGL